MLTPQNFKQQRQSVYRHIAGYNLEAIENAKVMVVGAGALGNEVLKNLALLNVGHILIVDFDVIEPSNLSRSVLFRQADCDGLTPKSYTAAKRLKEINPNIKIKVINGDILADVGLGVFRRMDSIIGCLDNMVARRGINRSASKVGVSWIDGGLSDTSGVVAAYQQGHSCYECSLSVQDRKIIRKRFSCHDKLRRNASEGIMPTTPINASIIGALQVQEAMNQINKLEGNRILGKKIKFFGGLNEMVPTVLNNFHEELCMSDHTYSDIIKAKELSADMKISDLFTWAKKYFKTEDITLYLDDEFVINLMSEKTGETFNISKPRLALADTLTEKLKKKHQLPTNDILHIKDTISEIGNEFNYQELSLKALGIPHLHILRLLMNGEDKYVELTGDEAFLEFD